MSIQQLFALLPSPDLAGEKDLRLRFDLPLALCSMLLAPCSMLLALSLLTSCNHIRNSGKQSCDEQNDQQQIEISHALEKDYEKYKGEINQ